jgi:hypothetical protein
MNTFGEINLNWKQQVVNEDDFEEEEMDLSALERSRTNSLPNEKPTNRAIYLDLRASRETFGHLRGSSCQ